MSIDEAAAALAAGWGIDHCSLAAMTGGELNQLLRIDHAAGPFVLRISRQGRTRPAVAFEHRVIRTLEAAGVPVASLIPGTDGETLQVRVGRLLTLSRFVGGTAAEPTNPDHRALAARVLARIHAESRRLLGEERRPGEHGLRDERWWAWRQLRSFIASRRESLDLDFEEIATVLDDEIAELDARVGSLPEMHPTGVIHGDFNTRNLLIDDDGTAHVVDWDDCRFDFTEWELAQAAGHLCGQDVDLIREFVATYAEAGGPTTSLTLGVIPLFMRSGSVNEVFWVLDHAPDGTPILHCNAARMIREVADAAKFFRTFEV